MVRLLLVWPVQDYALGEMETKAAVRAKELRDLLGQLGPSFVKVGQALSSRPDLLPKVYLEVRLISIVAKVSGLVVGYCAVGKGAASERCSSVEFREACRYVAITAASTVWVYSSTPYE